ncbi:hypothetical protein ABT150_48250 [Streptomyces mirabilis]|uniref:hypothetical protein n=1 Tax=Streptomyces mirabilis TaxID=68239 RepID=UPI003319E607
MSDSTSSCSPRRQTSASRRSSQLTEQIQDLEGPLARLPERHAPQTLTMVGICGAWPSLC